MVKVSLEQEAEYLDLIRAAERRSATGTAREASGTGQPRPLMWYVLVVSPLCEKAVASRLKREFGAKPDATGELIAEGLATFVPIARQHVRRRGSPYVIERAAFPRYLFVGFADPPPWLNVFEVQGVQGVLGFGRVPYRIDPTLVGDLISRAANGSFDVAAPSEVQRGMRVVASTGTYRGFEGDVVRISKATETAQVLFEMFSGSVPVTILLDDLVSVSYSQRRTIG